MVLWEGSRQNSKTVLNESSKYLKCPMQIDERKINYLNVWIIKENDALHTDLYTKPIDRNTLLRADSMHPLSLRNGQSYSQLCRVKQICGHQSDFDSNVKKMTDKFKRKGYKDKTLNTAMKKTSQKPRVELLKKN